MNSVVPHGLDGPRRTLPNRRTLVKGAAWAAPTLAIATTAPAMAVSLLHHAQARAWMLSGSLAGVGLGGQTDNNLVSLNGVHAQATTLPVPDSDTPSHSQANPLSVSALGFIEADLSGLSNVFLSELLTFLTDTPVGAVNQYAYAHEDFEDVATAEVGGAGAVSDNGTLDLSVADGGSAPSIARLNLQEILETLGAGALPTDFLSNVADLTIDIGALGGRASMDSADPVPGPGAVIREYVLAHLRTALQSNAVGEISTALNSIDLIGVNLNTSELLSILRAIGPLGDLLSGLANVTADVQLDASQLTGAIPDDPNAALQMNLGEGTVTADLAALLGAGYDGTPSEWLNSRGPNTRLFADAPLPADAVTNELDTWVDSLIDRLTSFVTVDISVRVTLINVIQIRGSLADLLAGEGTVTVIGGSLTGTEESELFTSVGELIRGTLATVLDENALLNTALSGVNTLLSQLFDVFSNVVAITLNAQNDAAGTTPSYYQAIGPAGRYDVSALHLAVLDNLGLLDLSLGRGSVGENTPRS